jgi:hypothetical protein
LLTVVLLLLLGLLTAPAQAQPSLHEQAQLLGNPFKIQQQATVENSASGGGQRISQETKSQLLGKSVNLVKVDLATEPAASAPENAEGGIALRQHDVYVGGVRVWNGKFGLDHGTLTYSGGVAPTQIAIPLVTYPLGPLLLKVEAGFEFEGQLEARFAIGPSYPLKDSTVVASVQTDLYAAAYIDASARLLFLKGGIGGRIDVIDAQAGFFSTFYLNGMKPRTTNFGWARLMDGHVYGFLDSKILFGRWTRVWQHDFFNWMGACMTFTDGVKSCY